MSFSSEGNERLDQPLHPASLHYAPLSAPARCAGPRGPSRQMAGQRSVCADGSRDIEIVQVNRGSP
eukprot:6836556-Pyramimonas_sp.AAC.1